MYFFLLLNHIPLTIIAVYYLSIYNTTSNQIKHFFKYLGHNFSIVSDIKAIKLATSMVIIFFISSL